jgi:glucose-6-phosphate 1-dehydrogenase
MSEVGRDPLDFIVIGASGDLARRKIYPALFSLYCQGLLPERFSVYGLARSAMNNDQFRERISSALTCRYVPGHSCGDYIRKFLDRCHYLSGAYDSADSFLSLFQLMREEGGPELPNMVFYLAIPPAIFVDVARSIGNAGLVRCGGGDPWSRVVIEKPFGRDRQSSDHLTHELANVFTEEQTYRIDHYLGKEVIQNLMVLRFANLVFEPIWNQKYIERVWVDWRENIGIEGRAGYFDNYGIIRDVVQNHLLQIVAMIAMERPKISDARHIRDEKVKVLKSINFVSKADVVLGQYTASKWKDKERIGYREEDGVPADSITPTFAATRLYVDNERWKGVPFIIRAGKGMNRRENEVRLQFRDVEDNIFGMGARHLPSNELVIRIQPDEGVFLSIVSKQPGLDVVLEKTDLNLRYQLAFGAAIPDAYECLLMDVIEGDKSLFIRSDELEAAWDIFTPVLHRFSEERVMPAEYEFGSLGPAIDRIL